MTPYPQPESPEPLKVVAHMRADGGAWNGYASCRPGDVEAFAVTRLSDADAAIQAARNEAEAMRADARRLDWLDSLNQRLNAHYQTTYQWKLVLSPNVVRLMSGRFDIDLHDSEAKGVPSCRTAIDAAMKGDDQ